VVEEYIKRDNVAIDAVLVPASLHKILRTSGTKASLVTMRFLSSLSSTGALTTLVFALLSFTELVHALPSPQPDIPTKNWSQNRGKKAARSALRHSLEGRAWDTTTPGFDGSKPYAITAPYDNIWGALSDEEAASVVSWLLAQPSLNLSTTSDIAGGWDNTM
jgi:hypothetical protein